MSPHPFFEFKNARASQVIIILHALGTQQRNICHKTSSSSKQDLGSLR